MQLFAACNLAEHSSSRSSNATFCRQVVAHPRICHCPVAWWAGEVLNSTVLLCVLEPTGKPTQQADLALILDVGPVNKQGSTKFLIVPLILKLQGPGALAKHSEPRSENSNLLHSEK